MLKKRLKKESLDKILPDAFAVVREAATRTLGQRHFDVQLIGGMVLHEGNVAEMKTGEGKTLVATAAGLSERPDRKGRARRDRQRLPGAASTPAGWRQVYHFLGMSTGVIMADHSFIYDPEFTSTKTTKTRASSTSSRAPARRPTPPISPTAPTTNSALTTCATTWSAKSTSCASATCTTPSSTKSTQS